MKRSIHSLTLALAAALLGLTQSLSAQEQTPVVLGSGSENWFIGVGGGVNSIYDNRQFGKIAPAAELSFGKWFTPSAGLRIGYHGIQANAAAQPDTWFCGDNKFNLSSANIDVMFNLRNVLAGYRENRVWNPVAYLRGSGIFGFTNNTHRWAIGAGAGLSNQFRVSKHVSIALDLAAVIADEKPFRLNHSGRFITFPSATMGLVFNLGGSSFKRAPKPAPAVDSKLVDRLEAELEETNVLLSGAEDRISKLQKQTAKLDKLQEGKTYTYTSGVFIETVPVITTIQDIAQPEILYFEKGQTTLDQRELARLEFYALNSFKKDQKLLISGGADAATGSWEINMRLSNQRAEYVKNILVTKFGFNPANLETKADVIPSTSPIKGRIVTIEVK